MCSNINPRKNFMKKDEKLASTYDASSIQVLKGIEAVRLSCFITAQRYYRTGCRIFLLICKNIHLNLSVTNFLPNNVSYLKTHTSIPPILCDINVLAALKQQLHIANLKREDCVKETIHLKSPKNRLKNILKSMVVSC